MSIPLVQSCRLSTLVEWVRAFAQSHTESPNDAEDIIRRAKSNCSTVSIRDGGALYIDYKFAGYVACVRVKTIVPG
jgi:hypothetical protein